MQQSNVPEGASPVKAKRYTISAFGLEPEDRNEYVPEYYKGNRLMNYDSQDSQLLVLTQQIEKLVSKIFREIFFLIVPRAKAEVGSQHCVRAGPHKHPASY